jgi:multidrug transporter EmrE-like cation transporter
MGTEFTATATSSVVVLCARAIAGAVIAVFLILILNSLLKKNHEVKRILFILLVSVILITSTILFTTALDNIQNIAINSVFMGVIF